MPNDGVIEWAFSSMMGLFLGSAMQIESSCYYSQWN